MAHDLVIESGYVKCHDVAGSYHQDGIQAMGGTRLTFRNLTVDCLGNANLFVNQGGLKVSMPTDVICDDFVPARAAVDPVARTVPCQDSVIAAASRNEVAALSAYDGVVTGEAVEAIVPAYT